MKWTDRAKQLTWKTKLGGLFPVWLVVVLLGAWSISASIPALSFKDWTEAGQFGDSMGLVNSVFNVVNFLLLVTTLMNQREEMKANDAARKKESEGLDEQTTLALKQIELEARQTELIDRQTTLQQAALDESHRRLAMEAFVKIQNDVGRIRTSFALIRQGRNLLVKPDGYFEDFASYDEAMVNLKGHCLNVSLLFGAKACFLVSAIDKIYENTERLFSDMGAGLDELDLWIKNVISAIGLLWHNNIKPLE